MKHKNDNSTYGAAQDSLKLRPGSRRELRILAAAGNIAETITEIRLGIPLRTLAQRQGWSLRMKSFYECTTADWLWADVVIVQRALGKRQQRRLEWLHRRGVRVVYDIDDLLTEPARHLLSTPMLQQEKGRIASMLRLVSAISCSTPRLAQRLSKIGSPVFVTPNYGPGALPVQARHEDMTPVTVLVAASDYQIVTPLATALKQLQAERPEISVVAIGPISHSLREHGVQIKDMPLMSRAGFFQTIASLPNPIGTIPLDDSVFSSCKSAIKYFDYTAAGIPCICSDVPPYSDAIDPDRTGLLCSTDAATWYDALARLAASSSLRRDLNAAAQQQVQLEHGLEKTLTAWETLIGQLLADCPARLPPGPLQKVFDAMSSIIDPPAVWLRHFNRQRKQRSRARRDVK